MRNGRIQAVAARQAATIALARAPTSAGDRPGL
jgi:hypothetical protein